MLVQDMATLAISTMAQFTIVEIAKVAIFCTSILQETYSESNFIQDCHSMLVQNMASFAVAMVGAMEKNIEKKSNTQNFMKRPNITFSENRFFITFEDESGIF